VNIDVHEVTRGVSVTKRRDAQRAKHLEKTTDQQAPTTENKLGDSIF